MNNIINYKRSDLEEIFTTAGYKSFMVNQIFDWLYVKRNYNLDSWVNISSEKKAYLKANFNIDFIKIKTVEEDKDVKKFLFELADSNYIEAVLMYHDYGNSVCVSSQVGCNMGCHFCESGRLKKVRNLETFEMVEQIILIEDYIKKRIDSVVIMGIGEPLDNYTNVMNFIRIINDSKGINIGARHITISTCGLIPKIKELSKEDLQVNLAISLHAPNSEIRGSIMEVNKVYDIYTLIDTIKQYIKDTNRRVTLEYVMLNNVNDSIENALELAKLIRGMNVYVNLIPYNETNHLEFKKSTRINEFYDTLKKEKINVTVRREFGAKIDAACGQLRSKEVEKMKSFYLTDVGKVRTHNEDSVIILKNNSNEVLMVVADGMGGHKAGEIASSIVVNSLANRFHEMDTVGSKADASKWLYDNINDINRQIILYTEEHPESSGMGTTVVMALITSEYILFGNIGDSSGFIHKNGELIKITKDHTLVNLLVEAGNLTEEEAYNHPKKNVLMRALGANEKVELDIFDIVDMSCDGILLCSDGLTNMLSFDQINKVLNDDTLEIEQKVIKLIRKCNARGGSDNITVAYLTKESGGLK